MSWQAGIYTALTTDPLLQSFLPAAPPGKIFFGRIPPGIKVPFISFWSTGGPPPDWTFEPDYIEPITFQLSIFHESPAIATLIARRVDHLLCWTPIVFDDV